MILVSLSARSLAQENLTPAEQKMAERINELEKENRVLRSMQNQQGTSNKEDLTVEKLTVDVKRLSSRVLDLMSVVTEMKSQLKSVPKELAEMSPSVSGPDQRKIASYLEAIEAMNTKLSTFGTKLDDLGARLKKGERLNGIGTELESLTTELAGEKVQVVRLASAPQEFKIFTRLTFKAINGAKDFQVTLTAESAGKKIPLSNRPVRMSRQFLDGDPKPLETLTTDENGQFIISRQGRRSVPNGHNLRFDFDGDKQHRKSFYKSSYR